METMIEFSIGSALRMTLETRMIVDPVLELAAEEVHKAETPSTDGPYAALLHKPIATEEALS